MPDETALIEVHSAAVVQRKLLRNFPLILEIEAVAVRRDIIAIVEPLGSAGLVAGGIDRNHGGIGGLGRTLGVELPSAPDGVGIIDDVTGVELGSVGHDTAVQASGLTVEEEITAIRVGTEVGGAVTVEERELETEIVDRLLIGQNFETVLLALIFVQVLRVEGTDAGNRVGSAIGLQRRGLVGVIRNLVLVIGFSGDQADAAGVVDDVGEVGETPVLVGAIVNGIVARGRVLDALSGLEIAAREVVVPLSLGTAVFEARMNGAVTAAVEVDVSPRIDRPVLGLDIEHARLPETVLGRQRAGDERDTLGKTRVELAAEAGDAFRDQDVVDPVLHVGVIVPDVKASRGRGILAHPRKPEHQLAKGNVLPLAQVLDVLLIDGINRGPDAGHDLLPGLVQLPDDGDFLHLDRLSRAGRSAR